MIGKRKIAVGLTSVFLIFNNTAFAYESDILSVASTTTVQKHALKPVNELDSYLMEKYEFSSNRRNLSAIYGAAKAGDALAQHRLGDIYRKGIGVTKSDIVALMWYIISDNNGAKNADKDKEFTKKYMAFDQIAQADKMAEHWLKNH